METYSQSISSTACAISGITPISGKQDVFKDLTYVCSFKGNLTLK